MFEQPNYDLHSLWRNITLLYTKKNASTDVERQIQAQEHSSQSGFAQDKVEDLSRSYSTDVYSNDVNQSICDVGSHLAGTPTSHKAHVATPTDCTKTSAIFQEHDNQKLKQSSTNSFIGAFSSTLARVNEHEPTIHGPEQHKPPDDSYLTKQLLPSLAHATKAQFDAAFGDSDINLDAVIEYYAYRGKKKWWQIFRNEGSALRTILHRLIGIIDDHTMEIRVQCRALKALHRYFATHTRSRDYGLFLDFARDVLMTAKGSELRALKDGIDSGADIYDLEHLVFRTIPLASRKAVLQHFRNEAYRLYFPSHDPTNRGIGLSKGCKPSAQFVNEYQDWLQQAQAHVYDSKENHDLCFQPNKVLSDIDDTFYAFIHDKSFPRGTRYPGVLAFYTALKHGMPGQIPGHLVFVTARPQVAKKYTHSLLRNLGTGNVTVMAGSFRKFFTTGAMASKKFDNFMKYCMLFPEYHFVWIGDSGQGDIEFGRKIIQACRKLTRNVPHVFIHDIVNNKRAQTRKTSTKQRRKYASEGIFLFDSYVDAALIALQHGLISPTAAMEIARSAEADLEKLYPRPRFDFPRNMKLNSENTPETDSSLHTPHPSPSAASSPGPASGLHKMSRSSMSEDGTTSEFQHLFTPPSICTAMDSSSQRPFSHPPTHMRGLLSQRHHATSRRSRLSLTTNYIHITGSSVVSLSTTNFARSQTPSNITSRDSFPDVCVASDIMSERTTSSNIQQDQTARMPTKQNPPIIQRSRTAPTTPPRTVPHARDAHHSLTHLGDTKARNKRQMEQQKESKSKLKTSDFSGTSASSALHQSGSINSSTAGSQPERSYLKLEEISTNETQVEPKDQTSPLSPLSIRTPWWAAAHRSLHTMGVKSKESGFATSSVSMATHVSCAMYETPKGIPHTTVSTSQTFEQQRPAPVVTHKIGASQGNKSVTNISGNGEQNLDRTISTYSCDESITTISNARVPLSSAPGVLLSRACRALPIFTEIGFGLYNETHHRILSSNDADPSSSKRSISTVWASQSARAVIVTPAHGLQAPIPEAHASDVSTPEQDLATESTKPANAPSVTFETRQAQIVSNDESASDNRLQTFRALSSSHQNMSEETSLEHFTYAMHEEDGATPTSMVSVDVNMEIPSNAETPRSTRVRRIAKRWEELDSALQRLYMYLESVHVAATQKSAPEE